MPRILIPTTSAEDWKQFLADPEKHWKRGYSAMAAALSWEAANGLPPEIAALLGPDATLLLAIPEHKVALPGGRRESQCDVFALVRQGELTSAVAIEAKVNESFGPTLADWLTDASPGKLERMHFICDVLGLKQQPPGHIRYQLLHRTVAAIVEAERFKTDGAAMIVQSFSQAHRWFDDFAAFAELLGVAPKRGEGLCYLLPNGKILTLGWAGGSPAFL